ncbi:MAG: hypothetical protein ACREV1_14410 [Gammaproteobacteria bacterium]
MGQTGLLALVSIAMADGVIASFDTKFNDNFWRPITAIRAGNNDGNSSTKGDPTWEPFCVTVLRDVITLFDTKGSMTPKQLAGVHMGVLARGGVTPVSS